MARDGAYITCAHQWSRPCSNVFSSGRNPHPIAYLSIDVEGFDVVLVRTTPFLKWDILNLNTIGWDPGNTNHCMTRCIYWIELAFFCYWAGNNGLLWQVTNCWLEHYHIHAWSNVACINRNDRLMRSVAENMQERFLSTLALGETFHGWGPCLTKSF